uniref:Uncharacterized protein n=1 Tax=Arundo donax TaxID=35708 RepID=A0A0A9DCH8_ARUDO
MWMRFWKEEQCAKPSVWPPDSTTRSLVDSPRPWNACFSCSKLAVGPGSVLVSFARDTRPSRRPTGTTHDGPPDCIMQPNHAIFFLVLLFFVTQVLLLLLPL